VLMLEICDQCRIEFSIRVYSFQFHPRVGTRGTISLHSGYKLDDPDLKQRGSIPFALPLLQTEKKLETKLRGFNPQANYIDRATAACWRS
jgi:hypothetical protein